jgi:phosphomannomutase/phosphoglucomutase
MDIQSFMKQLSAREGGRPKKGRLHYVLSLLGLVVLAATAWLLWTDWRVGSDSSRTAAAGQAAINQLAEPVQSLQRILSSEQVQSLAVRAIDNPETSGDLLAYLRGRISQVSDARVFPADLEGVRPRELGPNGYALLDMVLTVLEANAAPVQIHHALSPPALADAIAVKSDDGIIGALVVTLAPEYLLSSFEPDLGSIGFVRLTQYNGRQPVNTLGEFGDARLLSRAQSRQAVPGTLFRIEYPGSAYVQKLSGQVALTALLIGLALIGAAVILGRRAQAVGLEAEETEPALADRASLRDMSIEQPPARPRIPAAVDVPEQPWPPAPPPGLVAEEEATQQEGKGREEESQEEEEVAPVPDIPPPLRLHYDIAERYRMREAEHTPVEVSPGIFRAYDIRGVIDRTLDSGVARKVGQAVGTVALERDAAPVVVARDGRLSGPYLMKGMIEGIRSTGCDVLDIGAVPTGVLYYAAHEMASGSGVMITGSHNPPDYNGFKIMIGGDTLYGDAIMDLYRRITEGELAAGEGTVRKQNVVPEYVRRIADDIQVDRPMKVVVDCGNGIGGVCAADALRAIGVEVLPLFDEVDGTFPNHHPDPSEPENLVDLIESVRLMDADLGLALDGDADRLGVVTLAGDIIFPDRVLMLLAIDVLDRNPGATIIYDVKCTHHLPRVIEEAGGNPVMYKTGHSLIKARMKELGSPFAGEMSGHFFFGERWYGVDDGIYAAARLLEILGGTETPPEAILNALPASFSTPELKVQMQEGENHSFIEEFKAAASFGDARLSTIDGLRADFEDGWGLVRASNTTPILVVRFDAETEEALERIKGVFREQMLAIRADLELPF